MGLRLMTIVVLKKVNTKKSDSNFESLLNLPAGFEDARDGPVVSELAETDPRHLELTQVPTRTTSELAAIAQSDWRGVARELVERILRIHPLFF